jgi:hypothetical protein
VLEPDELALPDDPDELAPLEFDELPLLDDPDELLLEPELLDELLPELDEPLLLDPELDELPLELPPELDEPLLELMILFYMWLVKIMHSNRSLPIHSQLSPCTLSFQPMYFIRN